MHEQTALNRFMLVLVTIVLVCSTFSVLLLLKPVQQVYGVPVTETFAEDGYWLDTFDDELGIESRSAINVSNSDIRLVMPPQIWEKFDQGNPILGLGELGSWDDTHIQYPWVIKEGESYRMWYTGIDSTSTLRIGFANSVDGLTWIKNVSNPVFEGVSGAWDDLNVGHQVILSDAGIYKMWYSGQNSVTKRWQTGYAISSDGINWERYYGNPVLPHGPEGSWDHWCVWPGSVIFNGTGYEMWYTGNGYDGTGNAYYKIGYAWSADGIYWTKYPNNPILELVVDIAWGGVSSPKVIFENGVYKMWYCIDETASAGDGPMTIGYATSIDGINWITHQYNPVINMGDVNTWDSAAVSPGTVIHDGVSYKMWYTGYDGITARIGYAKSTNLSANFETTGYLLSVPISLPTGYQWHTLSINKTEFANHEIYVSVLNATTNEPLPGYAELPATSIDLTPIYDMGCYEIRLKATFVGNGTWTPILHDWLVTWSLYTESPIVFDIPDITFNEDTSYFALDLDEYVYDPDNLPEELSWSCHGNTHIEVLIDPVTHIVTLNPYLNWSGTETLTFVATDPVGASDSDYAVVTVNPINDPPVVLPLPDVIFDEDTTYTPFDLDDYLIDSDNTHSEIYWTCSGNTNISVMIEPDSHIVTFSALENWYGTDDITFIATDPYDTHDSTLVEVIVTSVNDAPVVELPPQIEFDEDTTYSLLALDDYVFDIDHNDAELVWEYYGNIQINVSIDLETHIVTLSAPANWSGTEQITFIAYDPLGATGADSLTIQVAPVNDAPVIVNFPSIIEFDEDTSYVLSLNNYVYDADNLPLELSWEFISHPNIIVSIDENNLATFTTLENWYSLELATFTVYDPYNANDSMEFQVQINPINDAPVVGDIPDIIFDEDTFSATIDLDNFVVDVDNSLAELNWSYYGNENITVSIDMETHVVTFGAPPNWEGSELITFVATDTEGASDSDVVLVTVLGVNDPPVILGVPDIYLLEDVPFELDVSGYISDPDTPLEYLHIAEDSTYATVSGHVITFLYPDVNLGGVLFETVRITVSDGHDSTYVIINVTVTPVNDPPIIYELPQLYVIEDVEKCFDISPFIYDVDNTPAELMITVTSSYVTVENMMFIFLYPEGITSELVYITVSDGLNLTEAPLVVIVLPVNDAPNVSISSPANNETFVAGELITFSAIATDPEDGVLAGDAIQWYSALDGNFGAGAVVELSTLSIGTHQITVVVTDTEDASAVDTIYISILEDSDADGVPDVEDPDDDNDGFNDTVDIFPEDPTESADTDEDGIGNNIDFDDDNDGYFDDEDEFTNDATEWNDADNDGIGDNADEAVTLTDPATGSSVTIVYTGTGDLNITETEAPGPISVDLHGINVFVEVTVSDTIELQWALVAVPYNESELPPGVEESKLQLFWWTGTGWTRCENTWVDTDANIVYANVTHFTIFAPMVSKAERREVQMEVLPILLIILVILLSAGIVILAIFAFARRGKLVPRLPQPPTPRPRELTNRLRLQLLDEKYRRGEISEDTYEDIRSRLS